jgi:hypothetical protein
MTRAEFWVAFATVASYGVLAGLQVLWWIDSRQWHRHMTEGIRAQAAERRRGLTRRAGGSRPPLP